MADTSLDADLDEMLWSTVNMFHRATDRIERKLDDNEQAQKRRQREQDGSEVKAVQLEHLIATGQSLLDRRDCMEVFRDHAAEHYLAPDRLTVVDTLRIAGQSPQSHGGNDRQSGFLLAAKTRADTEGLSTSRNQKSPSPGDGSQRSPIDAGIRPRTRSTPSTPTWCCCMADRRPRAELDRRQMGGRPARSPSRIQARLDTPRQGRPLQAQRSNPQLSCPSASSSSPAQGSKTI